MEGHIPTEVHFHVKRHPASSLPTTYIGLEKWLQELWREKDSLLETVYKEEKIKMPHSKSQLILPLQYVSLAAWLTFTFKMLLILLTTWAPFHWLWIIAVSSFMALVSHKTAGLQELEVSLDDGLSLGKIFHAFIGIFKTHDD